MLKRLKIGGGASDTGLQPFPVLLIYIHTLPHFVGRDRPLIEVNPDRVGLPNHSHIGDLFEDDRLYVLCWIRVRP